jgi:hypothetical protein
LQQVLHCLNALTSSGKHHGTISPSTVLVKNTMEIRVIDPVLLKACGADSV